LLHPCSDGHNETAPDPLVSVKKNKILTKEPPPKLCCSVMMRASRGNSSVRRHSPTALALGLLICVGAAQAADTSSDGNPGASNKSGNTTTADHAGRHGFSTAGTKRVPADPALAAAAKKTWGEGERGRGGKGEARSSFV
jgi:hypothetical protein